MLNLHLSSLFQFFRGFVNEISMREQPVIPLITVLDEQRDQNETKRVTSFIYRFMLDILPCILPTLQRGIFNYTILMASLTTSTRWCVEHKSFPVEKVKKAHMLSWHTCWGVSWIPIESVHRRRCLVRSSLEFTHGIRDTQSHSWLKSCQRTIERLCGSHACTLEMMMMMAMIIMIITKIAVTPSLLFESKEAYTSCHQTSS